jgi:hypothetical protein
MPTRTTLAIVAALLGAAPALAQQRIGAVVHLDPPLAVVIPGGADSAAVAWSHDFVAKGAPWVQVHFRRFDLPDATNAGRLEIGEAGALYHGAGPVNMLTDDGFWSDVFDADRLTLRAHGDHERAIAFTVDRWAYGDPVPAGRARAAAAVPACFSDVKCLAATDDRYKAAKAVARLRIEFEDESWGCTGFLAKLPGETNPPSNRVLTAGHCFPYNNPTSITAEFGAERSECKNPPGNETCSGESFAYKPGTFFYSKCCDVAMFESMGAPGDTYGVLELKSEANLTTDSNLYKPSHPMGRCKEYSEGKFIKTDANDDKCLFEEGACLQIKGSGSPLLDKSDYKVVGVAKGSLTLGKVVTYSSTKETKVESFINAKAATRVTGEMLAELARARDAGDVCLPLKPDEPTSQAIAGQSLVVKDASDPSRRKLTFLAKDPAIMLAPGGMDDPRVGGLTLQLLNPVTGELDGYELPAQFWTASGTPVKVYKYRDAHLGEGPIKTASVTQGKLVKASGQGVGIGFTLDEASQGQLAVLVTAGGGTEYCALFGGTIKKDVAGSFIAKTAPATPTCPAPPP